jgi:chromosome segregation ATPase
MVEASCLTNVTEVAVTMCEVERELSVKVELQQQLEAERKDLMAGYKDKINGIKGEIRECVADLQSLRSRLKQLETEVEV